MRSRIRKRSQNLFESRTEVWRQVGLGEQVDRSQAKRSRWGALGFLLLIAATLLIFEHRGHLLPGSDLAVRIGTVIALVLCGWGLARSIGQGIAPVLMGRLEPSTAGIAGFLIRLVTMTAMLVVALRIAGLDAGTLAAGGAFTAVVLGLAAQQTLGNLIAGIVLLSTRPFQVGDRVRMTGGVMAGSIEGIVGSLGLFYTTLVSGADRTMVPNSVILQLAIAPLREPERVEMRARLDPRITPAELQRHLAERITVPTRYPPDIALEELDREELIVRIAATPLRSSDGAQLAAEVLDAVRAPAAASNGR